MLQKLTGLMDLLPFSFGSDSFSFVFWFYVHGCDHILWCRDLSGNNLSGQLPPSLGNLSSLTTL